MHQEKCIWESLLPLIPSLPARDTTQDKILLFYLSEKFVGGFMLEDMA